MLLRTHSIHYWKVIGQSRFTEAELTPSLDRRWSEHAAGELLGHATLFQSFLEHAIGRNQFRQLAKVKLGEVCPLVSCCSRPTSLLFVALTPKIPPSPRFSFSLTTVPGFLPYRIYLFYVLLPPDPIRWLEAALCSGKSIKLQSQVPMLPSKSRRVGLP